MAGERLRKVHSARTLPIIPIVDLTTRGVSQRRQLFCEKVSSTEVRPLPTPVGATAGNDNLPPAVAVVKLFSFPSTDTLICLCGKRGCECGL